MTMILSSPLPLLKPSSSPFQLQNLHCPFDPCSQLNKPLNTWKSQNLQTFPQTICRPPNTQITTHAHHLRQLIESKSLSQAMNFYVEAKNKGTQFGVVLESMLIDAFMKSGLVADAFKVFDEMRKRNVVTWTSMIQGCTRNSDSANGLSLFVEMIESGVIPNDFAFSAALQACADLAAWRFVDQLVSLIIRLGLESDSRIRICLIDFYARCGLMDEASRIFDGMVEVDVVSFTSLISGFCRNNMFDSAVTVFDRMVRQGVEPNEHSVTSALMACGPLLGEQIHAYMVKTMIDQSVYSSSALIELYSRSYEFNQAKLVFEKLDDKNVVSWSLMISCCLHNNQAEDALKLFQDMIFEDIKPNEFTFATTIQACRMCSGSIKFGQQLHCLVIKLNLVLDNRISNALITMYSRSGGVEELEKVFKRTKNRDVASWCAAISGYFQNGFIERSIRLLCEMHKEGYTPNEYGISSALSSCANLAVLDQGRQFHCLALKSGCDFDLCIGNALVNMYGKCGFFDDARLVFDVMTTHDVMSWNSLIHSYAHHGHGQTAIKVFDEMVELNRFVPDHSTFVAILVACNHMGCVGEAIEYFKVMKDLYGIIPSSSHYACLVDMMGRVGLLSEALHVIEQMPFEPNVLVWKTLLGSCRLHGNLELGKLAAEKVLELSPEDSAAYILLSNLYAMHEEWEDVERVRMMMEDRGVKKDAGWSWIEVKGEVHAFLARDESHPKSELIYQRLTELYKVIKGESYSID
nr:pentatricopeptide repeat protein AaPPR887 [Agave angustifolia]